MSISLSPVTQRTENNEEDPTNEVTYEPKTYDFLSGIRSCRKFYHIIKGICCFLPFGIILGGLLIYLVLSGITASQFDITCRLNNQSNYYYITGDTVSVMITALRRGRPILNLKDVRVKLIGEFVFYTVYVDDEGETLDSHNVRFLDQIFTSHSMNISKKSRVPIGNDRRLFSTYLDHTLPSSINSNTSEIPDISYTVKIEIVPSEWYYVTIRKEHSIFIQRQLSRHPDTEKVIEQNKDSRDIQMFVSMEENTVIAGEMLEFNIDLRNPYQRQIYNISSKFDQLWDIGLNNSGHINIGYDRLEDFQSFRNKNSFNNYQLDVPKTSPGTFSYHLPSSRDKSFKLRYELIIEVQFNDGLGDKRVNVTLSPIILNLNHIIDEKNS